MNARWPVISADVDPSILVAAGYIRSLGSKIRSTEEQLAKKKKGKKGPVVEEEDVPKTIRLYVATEYPEWQEQTIEILKKTYNETDKTFAGDREMLTSTGLTKNKNVMPFAAMIKRETEKLGTAAFERKLVFSEMEALETNLEYIRRDLLLLKINKVEVIQKSMILSEEELDVKKADLAVPGQPTYRIF